MQPGLTPAPHRAATRCHPEKHVVCASKDSNYDLAHHSSVEVQELAARPRTLLGDQTRTHRSSSVVLHRTFVDDHPGSAELVPEHAKAESKECLSHGHEDLAAVGEQSMNPLRLLYAVEA